MPFVRIWIHCVWGTKKRAPLLSRENRQQVLDHIRTNAELKNIYIDCINGGMDHLHCIISLNRDQSIAKVVQLIKGESSYWINKQNLCAGKFEWADEYFAVSIGESQLRRVRKYITNQELHHRKKTWTEEYQEFVEKYHFARIRG